MKPEKILPLGDQAVLAYFAREEDAVVFATAVERRHWPWVVDVVPAYASVAVFFDLRKVAVEQAVRRVGELAPEPGSLPESRSGRLVRIPCCYEFGPDLERVSRQTGLAA